jgi:hypothetical protein
MQDAGDDAPVILAFRSGLVARHERLDHRPLRVRKPEQVRHHHLRPVQGESESGNTEQAKSLVRF